MKATGASSREEEDDEVDMIPLIDVSFVLLFFFIMGAGTAASGGALPPIQTPHAENGAPAPKLVREVRIDIDLKTDGRSRNAQPLSPQVPLYSIYLDGAKPNKEQRELEGLDQLMAALKPYFDLKKQARGKISVIYNAHEEMEDGFIVDMLAELEKRYRNEISLISIGVREK